MDTKVLLSPRAPHYQWIQEFMNTIVLKKFKQKNVSYGKQSDEFHNLRQTATRYYPDLFKVDPWGAMAMTAGFLKDKHEVSLAKDIDVNEAEERMLDCIVYDLFRIRFKLLQYAQRASSSADLSEEAVLKLFSLYEEEPCCQQLPTPKTAKAPQK